MAIRWQTGSEVKGYNFYGLSLCRAFIFGKKLGGERIHLCGREENHAGLHQCYCGHRWKKTKGSRFCHTWQPSSSSPLQSAEPSASVGEEQALNLYGRRKIDLSEEEET